MARQPSERAQKAFKKAHEYKLIDPSLTNKQIGNLVSYSASTVSSWLNFKTYREYLNYQNERLRQSKNQSTPTREFKTKENDLQPIIDRLDKIIELLRGIQNKRWF